MIYVLYGQDDFSIKEELEKIKESLGERDSVALNTTVLEGRGTSLEQLRNSCEAMPFLASHRLVIVKDLLEQFEEGARGQQKPSPAKEQKERLHTIGDFIARQLPPSTVLVLMSSAVKESNPLLKLLDGKATVKKFPSKKGKELQDWIRGRVREGQGEISFEAVQVLAQTVGDNLWAQDAEIQKLLSYTSGRRIERKDVEEVVSHVREANIFGLMDTLLERRPREALSLLHRLLPQARASNILALMARQVRLVLLARDLAAHKVPRTEMPGRLGGIAPYAVEKALSYSSRYSLERLKDIYDRLLKADLGIKEGRFDDEVALEILVGELCA